MMKKNNAMKIAIITTLFLGSLILNNIVIVVVAENVDVNNGFSKSDTTNNDYLLVNYTYEWPMCRHDLNNIGHIESDAPDTNNVLWTFTTGGAEVRASPVVVNGRVFVGTSSDRTAPEDMYCLDATNGSLIWNFTAGGQIIRAAAVANGKVYFGTYKYPAFYCLDEETGELIWNITIGIYDTYTFGIGTDPIYHDGKIFVGAYDYNLYALDANNGSILWNFTTGHINIVSTPVVVGGKVIFGSVDKSVYCLNEKNGSLIWRTMTDTYIGALPTVLHNKVYVGDTYNKVYCLDISNGEEIWNYTGFYEMGVANGFAIDEYSNTLFFGVGANTYYDNLYCLNASTGEYIWSTMTLDGYVSAGAPVVADGKVYVGSTAYGYVYCYNASSGDLIWYYYPPGGNWATGGLAIAYNKLYVGMYDYKVYCFGLPTDKPTADIDSVSTNFTVEGKNITFAGHGNDTDSEIIKYYWESNIDGIIGVTPTFTTNKLSVGNHTIIFKVLDSDGEWSDDVVVNVTVRSNDKPVIVDIDDLAAPEDELFSFYVNAFDPDNDTISFYDDTYLFEINSTTGLISFTPTNDDVGVYNVTITVTDIWGAEAQMNFTLVVENVNDKPTIDYYNPTISNPTINENESIMFNISASDIDVGDVLSYEWYVNGVLKGGNSSYNFITDYNSSGIYEVRVVVIDNGTPPLLANHSWVLTVLNKNRPPILETIGNQTAYEDQLFTLQINATDLDDDTLTFLDNSTLFDINPTTGLISFTPNYDSAGIYWINITVTDEGDLAYQVFKLTIINVNRKPTAIILSPSNNAKFTTNDNIFFDATGSSDPDNDNLIYTWISSVDGNIGSTASFSRKLSKGRHTITLTVDDGNGSTDTKQITITVNKPTSDSKPFIPMLDTWVILGVIGIVFVLLNWYKKKK